VAGGAEDSACRILVSLLVDLGRRHQYAISCLVHIERERKLLTLRLAKELEEAASAAAAASGANTGLRR
jgi:hypothetical protein